ncbi:hypothetical protein NDU88_005384 [Pleurodeles waltl]|uniref:Uncharacterized protein n=1 Tax=Pleurodeles waltl TaxID=8319 RepID=A0AAV7NRC8_PLEWA|nr:hypothetical protein NDU88_005384 [Pleurodeles waltl]
MSAAGWRPNLAPRMRREPARHGIRAGRGPELQLRVPGVATRLPRRACRPQPQAQTQQLGQTLAACRAAAAAETQLRPPVWASGSRMGDACPLKRKCRRRLQDVYAGQGSELQFMLPLRSPSWPRPTLQLHLFLLLYIAVTRLATPFRIFWYLRTS